MKTLNTTGAVTGTGLNKGQLAPKQPPHATGGTGAYFGMQQTTPNLSANAAADDNLLLPQDAEFLRERAAVSKAVYGIEVNYADDEEVLPLPVIRYDGEDVDDRSAAALVGNDDTDLLPLPTIDWSKP